MAVTHDTDRRTRECLGVGSLTYEGSTYRATLPRRGVRLDPYLDETADVMYWRDGPGRVAITPTEVPSGALPPDRDGARECIRTGRLLPNGSSVRASVPADAVDDDPLLDPGEPVTYWHETDGRIVIEPVEQPVPER
jgi:hypothetical protein